MRKAKLNQSAQPQQMMAQQQPMTQQLHSVGVAPRAPTSLAAPSSRAVPAGYGAPSPPPMPAARRSPASQLEADEALARELQRQLDMEDATVGGAAQRGGAPRGRPASAAADLAATLFRFDGGHDDENDQEYGGGRFGERGRGRGGRGGFGGRRGSSRGGRGRH